MTHAQFQKRLNKIDSMISEVVEQLETLKDEAQEAFDEKSERWQERVEQVEEALSSAQYAQSSLQGANFMTKRIQTFELDFEEIRNAIRQHLYRRFKELDGLKLEVSLVRAVSAEKAVIMGAQVTVVEELP
jgi:hypothetical protein